MSLSNFENQPRDICAIPAESLAKTSFGIVASLGDLFAEFTYAASVFTNERGSITLAPAGYYFIASQCPTINTWETNPGKRCAGLYVRPLPHVESAIQARCFARQHGAPHGVIGGFKIIPWPATGHALIVAGDEVHICNPFVAFVPLDALPVINSDNTPVINAPRNRG